MDLIILPNRNQLRRDMTGGFYPWACAYQARRGGELFKFDLDAPARTRQKSVLAAIDYHKPTTIALFTHGLRTELPQLRWSIDNLTPLAQSIAASTSAPRVILYACSAGAGTADGDFSFADTLRDALCTAGAVYCQVDAHTTPGRADANPMVRRFEGNGKSASGKGGFWLVEPHEPEFKRWRSELGSPDAELAALRWDFPFLTRQEILDYLRR